MTTQRDLDAFLDQTIFGLDSLAMIEDIEDFIDFSEGNIDWQRRRELRQAERECADTRFDDPALDAQYHHQMIEGVAFRFEVSLTQRVRYAALTSLITTVEWVLISLKNRATFAIAKKPEGKSEAVHTLGLFNEQASLDLTAEIQMLEALVQVRNCIVHAAGLLASYRYAADLRKTLSAHPGIKVSNINFLGDAIEIEQGYLQGALQDIKRWLPELEKAMNEQGLLKQ